MSPATPVSIEKFLAEVPTERQPAMRQVWEMVRAAMPAGYTEHIEPKFLEFRAGKEVYLALANQKNYISLYLMTLYVFPGLREELAAAAPKLKSGKSCLNFKHVEELPLDVLARIVGAVPMAAYVTKVQEARSAPRAGGKC